MIELVAPATLDYSTLPSLLKSLPDGGSSDAYKLDCSRVAFVRPAGLSAMVALIDFLINVKGVDEIEYVAPRSADVEAYMHRMGIYDILGREPSGTVPYGRSAALCEVRRVSTDEEANDAYVQINKVICSQLALAKGVDEALAYAVPEVIANIRDHSVTPRPGWVSAQTYATRSEVEVSIVDVGIGLLGSTTGVKHLSHITSDEEAVKWALKKRETSKPGPHTGEGLFLSKCLVMSTGGRMGVYSGRVQHIIYPGVERSISVPRWQGTIVSLVFRTDRPVDVAGVILREFPEDREDLPDDSPWSS